ncbi:MAG: hypothetical protein C0408_01945, partial [Odoribacter sp.]|nr:hypothetical protein [Odoribacter sp.]
AAWVQTISGGRGGYTYRWYTFNGNIPGAINTYRIDNIIAGKYYLETKDVLGCVKIDSLVMTEPNGMLLSAYQLSSSADANFNISCNGGNDGFIKLTITGGSGIYNYNWTGPGGFTSTTRDITGLIAGTYSATVIDLNGCILMPQPAYTLTQPAALSIAETKSLAPDGLNNINCNGGTGSINLTITGGSIGTYKYNWSTVNGSGLVNGQKDQSALTAGTYHIVVTDSNLCVSVKDITLTQPQPLITSLTPTHITCQAAGFDNGSIDLTVTGGASPYIFNWSNGAFSEDINSLTQGLYKVTVTDGNGCLKKDSVIINLPPSLTFTSNLSSFNGVNIRCFGLSDGSIQIIPVTGKSPYIYNWTGPDGYVSSNQNITGLKAGQYSLQITDANLCTATGIFNLSEPGKLDMTVSLSASTVGGFNINCAGTSTGSINLEAVNNVGTTNWLWSDGYTGKSHSNIPAGTYRVILTDLNNCNKDSTIILTEPDSIKISFDISQAFCPDSPDGEIQINVTGGIIGAGYSYKWSDNSTSQNLANILKGKYRVIVTDANNCSVKDSVEMEPLNETCLVIPNAISPNGDNINDVWNIGMIHLYPQMEIKIFNRWGEILWRSERGYPNPWDGRSKGALLPIDSYHYIIDLHNGSKPVLGNVTIVR